MPRFARVIPLAVLIAACHRSAATTTAAVPPTTTTTTTTASSAPAPSVAARPAGISDAMIASGDSIFHAGSCFRCHGATADGGANGPSLKSGKWLHIDGSFDSIVRIVTTGVPADSIVDKTRRFNMRPRGGLTPPLTDDQVRAVAAYVWSISHS